MGLGSSDPIPLQQRTGTLTAHRPSLLPPASYRPPTTNSPLLARVSIPLCSVPQVCDYSYSASARHIDVIDAQENMLTEELIH